MQKDNKPKNDEKITLDNFPRTKMSFKNLLATNDLSSTLEKTSKHARIELNTLIGITVDNDRLTNEIDVNRRRATEIVEEAENPVNPADFAGEREEELLANKIWESRERQRVSKEKLRNGYRKALALLKESLSDEIRVKPYVESSQTVGELYDQIHEDFEINKSSRASEKESILDRLECKSTTELTVKKL
jgi:cytochrome c556